MAVDRDVYGPTGGRRLRADWARVRTLRKKFQLGVGEPIPASRVTLGPRKVVTKEQDDAMPVVLLVDGDILVRGPLAEYLRECGFRVFEAATGDEAMLLLNAENVSVVLADMATAGSGFALLQWIKAHHPSVHVILAGSIEKEVAEAGDLCNNGPALAKPYEHRLVLKRIQRAIVRRDSRST